LKASETSLIFVRFGGPRRGEVGRLELRHGARRATDWNRTEPTDADEVRLNEPQAPGRTMSETFSRREVCRLFDISEGRLRYWDRSGFLSPTGRDGRRKCYTFQDLISVRSAKTLLDNGITLQRTRRILGELREKLPSSTHPLGQLRIRGDGKTVVVADEECEFDADSGQLLLDFSVSSLEETIVSELPARRASAEHRTAYEWYLEGCRMDENEATLARAEEAYHRAIHLDSTLANAYTNLGNIRYRAGAVEDARALYVKAIEVDPEQPEAHYNLGFLEFEIGAFENAENCFRHALDLDPTFADAHFNLAMTVFRLGLADEARVHWKRYLSLEPTGPWADIARRRLQDG
jgi:DNA-binding transcriptional MerR regulator